MFMAVISNWLEMGLDSSRVSTAAASASEPLVPSSGRTLETEDRAVEDGASDEAACEEVLEEEEPQLASSAQLKAAAVAAANSLERFIMRYSLFVYSKVVCRGGGKAMPEQGGRSLLILPYRRWKCKQSGKSFTVSSPVLNLRLRSAAPRRCSPQNTGRWR